MSIAMSPLDRIAALEAGQRILTARLDALEKRRIARSKPYRSLKKPDDDSLLSDIQHTMRFLHRTPRETWDKSGQSDVATHLGFVTFSWLCQRLARLAWWRGVPSATVRAEAIRLLHRSPDWVMVDHSKSVLWCGAKAALVLPRAFVTQANRSESYAKAMDYIAGRNPLMREAMEAARLRREKLFAKPVKLPKGRRTRAADEYLREHPGDYAGARCRECGCWLARIEPPTCKYCEHHIPTNQ